MVNVYLSFVTSAAQRVAELSQEVHDVVARRQRAHDSDAEDLSGKRAKAAGDVDAVLANQRQTHLCVVDAFGNQRRVQVPDAECRDSRR